jgi:hypothetical protein
MPSGKKKKSSIRLGYCCGIHCKDKKSMETLISNPVSSRDSNSENLLSRTGTELEIIRLYL